MASRRAWGSASGVVALTIWGCTSDASKDAAAPRASASAETAIDWRYGPCPENEPIPNPDNCGFPPGHAPGVATVSHEHLTCAGLGIGNRDTLLDTLHTLNDPTLGIGKSWPLDGGNKFILWMPEQWFFASSTPIDAVIVHLAGDNGPDDHTELSDVYRYVPATFASEFIQGFGPQFEDGAIYRAYAIEVCYTLPGSTGGGDDAGAPVDAGPGPVVDAGEPVTDAGPTYDAGDDASTDGGSTEDGGPEPDGGTTTTTF